jgi:hypothetical protein
MALKGVHSMDESKPETTPEDAATKAKWDDWHRTQVERVQDDINSGTDSFDKSMLTLSSGALGVSLAFVKDIVPLGQAVWVWLLVTSWVAFSLCIVVTVLSFRVSIAALKEHRDALDNAAASRQTKDIDQQTFHRALLKYCTNGAIFFFLVGLLFTMLFVCKNVLISRTSEAANGAKTNETPVVTNVRNFNMTDETQRRMPIEKAVKTEPLKKGREPMKMIPTPTAPTAPATNAPAPPPGKTSQTAQTTPCPAKE